jgi:hypothetical protein
LTPHGHSLIYIKRRTIRYALILGSEQTLGGLLHMVENHERSRCAPFDAPANRGTLLCIAPLLRGSRGLGNKLSRVRFMSAMGCILLF